MSGAAVGIAIGAVLAIGAGVTTAVHLLGHRATPTPGPVCHLCPAGHGHLGDEDLADHIEALHPDHVLDYLDDDEDAADATAAYLYRRGGR